MFLAGCRKGDKVPAYLFVNSVSVAPAAVPGTTTSRITDIRVSVDDELLGSWEVPARIPVLREGATKIQIDPWVKRNGTYDDRVRYPFYTRWEGTVDLTPEGNHVIQPQVEYTEQTVQWVESFEEAGIQLIPTNASNVELQRFTPQEHPHIVQPGGSPAAGSFLPGSGSYIRLITDQNFVVTGGPIFLELDYSTNVVLTIGILYTLNGVPSSEPYVYLVPTAGGSETPVWNKVYIDLSPVFNLSSISNRDIYIEAVGPASGTGAVFLDNVKLVRTAS
jgi:hypothetical protein